MLLRLRHRRSGTGSRSGNRPTLLVPLVLLVLLVLLVSGVLRMSARALGSLAARALGPAGRTGRGRGRALSLQPAPTPIRRVRASAGGWAAWRTCPPTR